MQLLFDGGVEACALLGELRDCRIDRRAKGCGPPAQGVHDGAQPDEGGAGGLPAIGTHDAAHRTPFEIRPRVIAQILGVINRILHKAGDRAVISRRRDYNAVTFRQ